MDIEHLTAGQKDSTEAGLPKEIEEVWHVPQNPQKLLQFHNREPPNQLHHDVVRQHNNARKRHLQTLAKRWSFTLSK